MKQLHLRATMAEWIRKLRTNRSRLGIRDVCRRRMLASGELLTSENVPWDVEKGGRVTKGRERKMAWLEWKEVKG